ncbi:MAG: hydrogenase nickel incorporation protein HypB [Clostridiales bacterium]|nr:hydrogenase nickel incorporation protein HypB [Clostridiales bacterium]
MSKQDVEIMADINAENDRLAEKLHQDLVKKGIFTINVIGAPGVGKTSTITRIIQGLADIPSAVVEGDIQSDIDTQALKERGIPSVQINTGGACHIDAVLMENTLAGFPLRENSLLWIENIGNLVCPAEFMIGEDVKMLICAATDGSDKPYKYPLAFEKAAVILINKADLLPHVDFDLEYFTRGIRALNAAAPIIPVSAKTGEGISEVCEWIGQRRSSR